MLRPKAGTGLGCGDYEPFRVRRHPPDNGQSIIFPGVAGRLLPFLRGKLGIVGIGCAADLFERASYC